MGTVGEAYFSIAPFTLWRGVRAAWHMISTSQKGDTMKFLVCIKQVVDTSKMEVDPIQED